MAKYADDEVKNMTGVERNIGPRMNRQDVADTKATKALVAERAIGPGTEASDFLNADDEYEQDINAAKAKAQKATGPKFEGRSKKVDVKKALAPFNMAKGGKVSSASKRADGIAIRGKTRGKLS